MPVNGITALRNSFIETMKPTTDLRYNLAWSFGGFLVDIPRRLGVNEALDSAVQVLVDSHQDFCAGLGVTSRVLVGYSRALRMLRSYLNDPVKARTSETLCSVMVLLMCQVRRRITDLCTKFIVLQSPDMVYAAVYRYH